LGKDTPHIGGGVTAKRSQEIVNAWNRGEIPVLLGHPQSMSHGLNMQEAGRAIIWHSLTWSLEDRMQFIRRIWRQGQTGRVFVYNIVARGTIDEALMMAVAQKAKGENALLNALRDYWANK
jgi:SNF2 family DNA or RNA helicase